MHEHLYLTKLVQVNIKLGSIVTIYSNIFMR